MQQLIPSDMIELPERLVSPKSVPNIDSTRLELALEASNIGIWEYDCETAEILADEQMRNLYFLSAKDTQFALQDWETSIHPDDLERVKYEFSLALEGSKRLNADFRVSSSCGQIRYIRAIGTLHKQKDGACRMVVVNWDVSADKTRTNELKQMRFKMEERNNELHQAKARLEHISLHDVLTTLPNRRYLEKVLLTHKIGAIKAVLMIDLDGFKKVNDVLGHAAGDELLKHTAKILQKQVRGADFVARAGGDEFVILCRDAILPESLENMAQAIISEIRRSFLFSEADCQVGASIGILAHADLVDSVNTVLRHADLALYEAKRKGRNCFEFFTEELKLIQDRKQAVTDEIRDAIERCDFIPYYQAQYCARTRKLTGMEVLARWRHPTHGILTPDHFLPRATELGLTPHIDRIILLRVLQDITRWQENELHVPKISVNVSPERLSDSSLIDELEQLNCRSFDLSFELVESIFLDDADERILSNLEKVREMGIEVELDDFGTAYTSLLSILRIRPSRLKIDRQLVQPTVSCSSTRQVVQSIVDIANSLDIQVVAEGIETQEHVRIMTAMGCHSLQGFVFGRPAPAEECDDLLIKLLKKVG